MLVGISVDAFWGMTPREVFDYVNSYYEREKRREKNILMGAWYMAAWQRCEKMPSLYEVLEIEEPQKTPEQEIAEWKALTVAMGGTIIE
jgi:hypothetical protein